MAKPRTDIDWERIEIDYRAGIKTLRQIASEHTKISHQAIQRRADRDGWTRDISNKIHQKTEELVAKAMVDKMVDKVAKATEREVIEANAECATAIVMREREDIAHGLRVGRGILDELEAGANCEDTLHERARSFGSVTASMTKWIETERKVLRIEEAPSAGDQTLTVNWRG